MLNSARLLGLGRRPLAIRHKAIYSEAYLDRAERLKLWNKENKQLYGALLETRKAKEKRLAQKEWKKKGPKISNVDELQKIASSTILKNISKTSATKEKSISKKIEEVLCIEKEILPERTVLTSPIVRHNLISASNKKGAHRVEIMTPNIKNNLFANTHVGVPSIIIRNLKLFPMLSNQKMNIANTAEEMNEEKILKIPSSGDVQLTKFPSVTKILDQTMSEESKAALEKWRQEKIAELGLEGFERFNKAQLERGKEFHSLIESHFLSRHGVSNLDVTLEGVWSSVTPILKNISSPKAIESHVLHPVLKYRGIIDCIAVYQDKPTLIEWKKSDKPKPSLSATYDNPVQLAAYFGAISHDANYKQLNVRDALLVIAYTDGSPADAFHLNADKMRQHWANWLTRLERYWTANESISVEKKPTEEKNES